MRPNYRSGYGDKNDDKINKTSKVSKLDKKANSQKRQMDALHTKQRHHKEDEQSEGEY